MKRHKPPLFQRIAAHELAYTRRVAVGMIGGTLLLLGIALLFLPGPALVVIPLSVVILATEVVWTRRLLAKTRELFENAKKSGGKSPP